MKIPLNLKEYMKKNKIGSLLFINTHDNIDPNFYYFSKYTDYGYLLLSDKKHLIVPEMEIEKAIALRHKTKCKVIATRDIFKTLKKLANGKKLGIDYSSITVKQMKAIKRRLKKKLVDISDIMLDIRAIKSKEEIANIKKACKITDNIFKRMIKVFKKFGTEKDIVDFIYNEANKNNCEVSFKPIIASGVGSSQPHYIPQNIKLRRGFCVIDFGVKYNGYCSDMTRTIYIGRPSKKEVKLYNLLLDTQEEIIKYIEDGKKCSNIYNFALKRLGKHSKNLIHGLGHGIGLKIHEKPDIRQKSKDKIKRGMVFTIEPGIYFRKKFGIRIEDTILMKDKPIILTKSTKELIIKRN